jgi:hypothetical protein
MICRIGEACSLTAQGWIWHLDRKLKVPLVLVSGDVCRRGFLPPALLTRSQIRQS